MGIGVPRPDIAPASARYRRFVVGRPAAPARRMLPAGPPRRYTRLGGRGDERLVAGRPAMDGVAARLTEGAAVADIGCGHGASAIVMAEAYPASRICGFDFHAPSIQTADKRAAEAGVSDRVSFATATAKRP